MSSLGEQFPAEQKRVRKLLAQYKEIGPAGTFGSIMIEQVLQRADHAAISGDIVALLQSYEEMKGCQ